MRQLNIYVKNAKLKYSLSKLTLELLLKHTFCTNPNRKFDFRKYQLEMPQESS